MAGGRRDVAGLRVLEVVDGAVDEDPLADVERRLHRPGRDPVRLDRPRLDREREADRQRDDQYQLEQRASLQPSDQSHLPTPTERLRKPGRGLDERANARARSTAKPNPREVSAVALR
jgi:hypothetical protein